MYLFWKSYIISEKIGINRNGSATPLSPSDIIINIYPLLKSFPNHLGGPKAKNPMMWRRLPNRIEITLPYFFIIVGAIRENGTINIERSKKVNAIIALLCPYTSINSSASLPVQNS